MRIDGFVDGLCLQAAVVELHHAVWVAGAPEVCCHQSNRLQDCKGVGGLKKSEAN